MKDKVKFLDYQEMLGGAKMPLFNLLEPVGPHCVGSTVSDRTLEKFNVPFKHLLPRETATKEDAQ
jgi:hypothetical protein